MLSSFSVENYRSFKRRQNIEIRPLTLFFGWNSSGKSALVRFLPLLEESFNTGGPPIWLAGEVGRKATWDDLRCKSGGSSIRFAIKWKYLIENEQYSDAWAEWEVKPNGSLQEVQRFELNAGGQRKLLISENETDRKWHSFIPEGIDINEVNILKLLQGSISIGEIQWISGVRVRQPRYCMFGDVVLPLINPDGGNALDYLIAAQLRSTNDPLLEIVRGFFRELGEEVAVDNPYGNIWHVLLHPVNAMTQVRVNICDVGEGYSQVMPVLVAMARAMVGGQGIRGRGNILCMEQPELHLHTHAQAVLANLMVKSAKSDNPPSLLVETHSEVMLSSIQLSIAKGELNPELVRVYWVESRPDGTSDAVAVDFDDQGRPTNTSLMSAFNDVIRLGQELVRIQLSRMSS